MKDYEVEVNGYKTVLQLSDKDAVKRGLSDKDAVKRGRSKAVTAPKNKAQAPDEAARKDQL